MPAMCNALASRREWSSSCGTLKVLCALVTMPLSASQGVGWLVNNSGEGVRQVNTPCSHELALNICLVVCLFSRGGTLSWQAQNQHDE